MNFNQNQPHILKSSKPSSNNLQKHQANTIDEKHTEMLEQFHENESKTIPLIELEIDELKTKIKTLTKKQIEQY